MPQLISSFLFSYPHEADLLEIKLEAENNIVEAWIAVENKFTFRGEPKVHYLPSLLTEPRFKKFLHKITILLLDFRTNESYKASNLDSQSDKIAFHAEYLHRSSITEILVERYPNATHVLISDVDEHLDTLDTTRSKLLLNLIRSLGHSFRIVRKQYVYDYNNVRRCLRTVPIIAIDNQGDYKVNIGRAREIAFPIYELDPLCFEYTYCFQKQDIKRKLSSFSHYNDICSEDLDRAFKYNVLHQHNLVHFGENETDEWWLENEDLSLGLNSHYVSKWFDRLKTGVIDKSYQINRRQLDANEAYIYPGNPILGYRK